MSYRGYGALRNGLVLDALCSEGAGVKTWSTKKNTLYLAPRKYVQNVDTVSNDWGAGGCLEVPFPPGSTNLKLIANGVDYDLVESVFTNPTGASTRIEVRSSNAGDNTQNLVIYGIVAGAETSESFTLNGVTWVNGFKDFTEVFEAYLDATCAGIITIQDSEDNSLGTIAAGRRVRSPDTFKRIGEHDNDIITPLCLGTEFVGEVLGGQWKKDWDADIVTYTARINGVVTGMLELGGESDSGGTVRSGWINNHHPFVMMNEAELTVEMEVPTSDTGVAAGEDLFFTFYLRRRKELNQPWNDPNFILIRYFIDENGLFMRLYKEIDGAPTLLWDGSTADGNDGADPAGDKFWIFRFVFHDHGGRHMHVYAKHGNSRANAEAAAEEELFDTVGGQASPYDISDLTFKVGYPAYEIRTAHTTWFGSAVGSGLEAISTYLRATYPTFQKSFVCADPSVGSVELWDGDPDGAGVQVFDKDHDFGGSDVYLQNGLIRCKIDQLTVMYPKYFINIGASWVYQFTRFQYYMTPVATYVNYPVVTKIVKISPEEMKIRVRHLNSAVEDEDYYLDYNLILRRGSYVFEIEYVEIYPVVEHRPIYGNPGVIRFGYAGDDKIADFDVVTGGQNNPTLTDNFMFALDDAGTALITALSSNQKPLGTNQDYYLYMGGQPEYRHVSAADLKDTILYLSQTPFPLVANLFYEAEDESISGAVRLNLVGAGEDTKTEGDSGDWIATNCVITDDADSQVGAQSIKVTSSGAGIVVARINIDNLWITKFDFLRYWLKSGAGGLDGVLQTNVYNAGGYVRKFPGITTSYVQKEHSLPHAADDLGDFDHFGYNFAAKQTHIQFQWTAAGAGEILYIDGLHEYIGNTTTRGRGETLSGGGAAVLDGQFNTVRPIVYAGTHFPAGRYLIVHRVKDTDQLADDTSQTVNNQTDAQLMNEENSWTSETSAATFAYFFDIFDITEADVASTDLLDLFIRKALAGENTIFVDYILIIPIGDGHDWPQDLSRMGLGIGTGDGTDDLWTVDDGGMNALDTDGVRQYMTFGISQNIRTAACRLRLNAASQGVVELAPGKYVSATNNVLSATGFDNTITFYVNGFMTTAIPHAEYVDIIIEMDGDEYAAALQFGLVNGTLNVVDVARAMAWTRVLEGFERRMVDEMRRLL